MDTERLFQRLRVKHFPSDVHRVGLRKLRMLHHATNLQDLRVPPANRLEALRGKRKGQYSIRVNNR
jgi:proteic killer suppression protein